MDEPLDIVLNWRGPFITPAELPSDSGVYAISGHVYGGCGLQLLYVGEAKNGLAARWKCPKHCDYFSRHCNVLNARLYCALLDDYVLDVETVLIYVHQPNHNTSKKNGRLPKQRYLIRSTGSVPPGLLGDVDSASKWFGLSGCESR